jgi:hypothetical protein
VSFGKYLHASLAAGSCATASCMITSFDFAGTADIAIAIAIVVIVDCCVDEDIALGMLCVVHVRKVVRSRTLKERLFILQNLGEGS